MYSTLIPLLVTLSEIKKNRIAICLVLSLFDLPFLSNAMVDILSWYTAAGPILNPCSSRKFRVHII